MKLKKVTVTFDFVMAVPEGLSESDNYIHALDNVEAAFRDMSALDMDIDIVDYNKTDISFGWTGDCIPYGSDGEKRTDQYED